MRRAALPALAVVLVLAACGGDDGDDAAPGATTEPSDVSLVTIAPPTTVAKPEVELPEVAPTELNTTVITEGSGIEAEAGDGILVRYVGVSFETEEEFDSNWGAEPLPVILGQGRVIAGWDEGLIGAQAGSLVQLDIPADLAYGATETSTTTPRPGPRPKPRPTAPRRPNGPNETQTDETDATTDGTGTAADTTPATAPPSAGPPTGPSTSWSTCSPSSSRPIRPTRPPTRTSPRCARAEPPATTSVPASSTPEGTDGTDTTEAPGTTASGLRSRPGSTTPPPPPSRRRDHDRDR